MPVRGSVESAGSGRPRTRPIRSPRADTSSSASGIQTPAIPAAPVGIIERGGLPEVGLRSSRPDWGRSVERSLSPFPLRTITRPWSKSNPDPEFAALGHAQAAAVDQACHHAWRPRIAASSRAVSGTLGTTGSRSPRLALTAGATLSTFSPSTSRQRNSSADSAWFWVLADACHLASPGQCDGCGRRPESTRRLRVRLLRQQIREEPSDPIDIGAVGPIGVVPRSETQPKLLQGGEQ